AATICIVQCRAAFETFDFGIERISLVASRVSNTWTATGINGTGGAEISVPAAVPGGIYSDLEVHGDLNSAVYHEYNDMENRWVGRLAWTFTRNFDVTTSNLEKTDIVLVCEGLDTVAEVFINEVSVGKSENMFARYVFDIKSALQVGQNTIRVAFQSPVEYAQTKFKEHNTTLGYQVVPEFLAPAYRGENQAQMIRKMQAAFSWDWGPSYPNSGIWKNIYVEAYNGAIIRDVMIFSTPSKPVPDETADTEWEVTARVYYDSGVDGPAALTFKRNGSAPVTETVALEKGKGKSVDIKLTESGDQTKLWWPNGYGEQNLYWYNVTLESETTSDSTTRMLRFGFRTVELIENFVDPADEEKGREFYFIVNGVQMYSKGSNSIPLHVLTEKITKEQTEWLLRAAKMSHQNMIRVWGGGNYESAWFYDV
ncbi:Beta-mannosidase, partial [Orchesella cincta]